MAQMHGKYLFTGIENVKGFFVFDVAPVHEIEYPWRICNHALYLHLWPRKAVVLGVWRKKKKTFEEHMLDALGGRVHVPETTVPVRLQPEQLQQGSREAFETFSPGAYTPA